MLTAVSRAAVSSQPKKPASTPGRLLVTRGRPLPKPKGGAGWPSFLVTPRFFAVCHVTGCDGCVEKAGLTLRAGPGGTVGSRRPSPVRSLGAMAPAGAVGQGGLRKAGSSEAAPPSFPGACCACVSSVTFRGGEGVLQDFLEEPIMKKIPSELTVSPQMSLRSLGIRVLVEGLVRLLRGSLAWVARGAGGRLASGE